MPKPNPPIPSIPFDPIPISVDWIKPISPIAAKILRNNPAYLGDCANCNKPVLPSNLGYQDEDGDLWHKICAGRDIHGRPYWYLTPGKDSYLILHDPYEHGLQIRGRGTEAVVNLPTGAGGEITEILIEILAQVRASQAEYDQAQAQEEGPE